MEEKYLNADKNDIIEDLDNEWSEWGAQINKEVENNLNEVGDRDNAHYFSGTFIKRYKYVSLMVMCLSR